MKSIFRILLSNLRVSNLFDLSAQLSYYILLSFFPFLLLAVTLLGYLPYSSENVLSVIKPVVPPNTYDLIENNLVSILDEQNSGILSFSIISTLYLASLAFHSIIHSLDQAYQVKNNRRFWKKVLLGFFLMFELLLGILFSLAILVFGQVIVTYFFGKLATLHLWTFIRWFLSSFLLFLILLSLYKFAPNTKVGLLDALPGAIFATLGWQLTSYGFSFYVSLNDYSLLYGNLGGIIVLTIWFYLSALILILGGHINAACSEHKKSRIIG